MDYTVLPLVNTTLNGVTSVLLVTGLYRIRKGDVAGHRACMLSAAFCSVLFLTSYLIYHAEVGSVPFQGQGAIRAVYFFILITHIVLAAVNVPLVAMTLYYAARDRRDKHRRIARITFPIWLYVSVTGVLVYLLLYHGP